VTAELNRGRRHAGKPHQMAAIRRVMKLREALRRATFVVVVALLLGAGCRADEGAAGPPATTKVPTATLAADLSRAADRTIEAGTGRVDVSSEWSARRDNDAQVGTDDRRIQMVGRRSYTYDLGARSYEGTFQVRTLVDLQYKFVSDGTTFWLQTIQPPAGLAPEGTWLAMPVGEMRAAEQGVAVGVEPMDILDLLRGAPPAVDELAAQVIDGVSTRRIHLVTSVNRQGGGLSPERRKRLAQAIDSISGVPRPDVVLDAPISLDVFIGPAGRVRRLDLTVETNRQLGEAIHQIHDFVDLSGPVTITVPPAGPIVDSKDVPQR
jgi:hypothetical protein